MVHGVALSVVEIGRNSRQCVFPDAPQQSFFVQVRTTEDTSSGEQVLLGAPEIGDDIGT